MKTYKLLNKITVCVLLFTIAGYALSTVILTVKANKYIEKNIARSFRHKKRYIVENFAQGEFSDNMLDTKIIKLNDDHGYILNVDLDSIMVEDATGESHLYRLHEEIVNFEGSNYLFIFRKNIEDFINMKKEVLNTFIPIFITLLVILLLLNIFLSGYLLKPFNHILNQMKMFRVGENFIYDEVKTSTTEFCTMQELYLGMVRIAEEDYHKLKEYTENMAHEFQTPLAIIRNKTEYMIADEKMMSLHSKSIKAIYDETNHLSKLGNTLKLLTKIENNEFVNREKLYSKKVIENHIEKLRELASLKSVQIQSSLYQGHIFEIDPYLLEIMLKNLIRNAILYSSANSTINVETTPDHFIISNHSDSTEEIPDDLFKRFSKGKSSKSSLGLGLAIVKKICDLNNLIIDYECVDFRHAFTINPVD